MASSEGERTFEDNVRNEGIKKNLNQDFGENSSKDI